MSITLKGLGSAVDSVNGKTGIVVLSPEDLGADSAGAASAVIVQHEAAEDPHPQYLTETEADAKYAAIGSGGTGGDPAGTAAALLSAHEAAADPHPQYLTQSEVDTQYAPKTHSHTSSQISDFIEAVEDMIGGSIIAGAGVSVTYNDGTGKTTVSASGGGGAGGGYAVQTRNGSLANQVHAFGLPAAQSSYGFDAYALKEESGLANQVVAVESFDSSSSVNYEQTGALVWNGQVRPYTGETVTLQPDGQFFSALVKADGESIEISAPSGGVTILPAMTSPTEPSGYSAFASSVYNGLAIYQPWYAFDKTNATEISDNTKGYWVSGAAPTASSPQWIEIRLPQPKPVTGYSVRNRNFASNVASANSWQLQGSNDGATWQVLHTVTGDTRNTAGLTRSFAIGSKTAAYSRFRLLITARNGSDLFVAVSELDLLTVSFLFKDQSNTYYSASSGVLSPVTEPADASDFDLFGFTSSGVVDSAQLVGKLPIRVVASSSVTAPILYTPYAQIAIPNSLLGAGAFSQINSATVTATQTGNGKVRLAVSRDLVNWYSWNGSVWVSIGTLAADTSSAEALLAGGMDSATVGGITVAQWAQFFASAEGGLPDKIAFAYALDVPDPTTDAASIDNVALNVNYNSAWLKQTPAQVEIRWYKDQVTFKTITAGNYKLAYQTP